MDCNEKHIPNGAIVDATLSFEDQSIASVIFQIHLPISMYCAGISGMHFFTSEVINQDVTAVRRQES